jgi:hypothetical protein
MAPAACSRRKRYIMIPDVRARISLFGEFEFPVRPKKYAVTLCREFHRNPLSFHLYSLAKATRFGRPSKIPVNSQSNGQFCAHSARNFALQLQSHWSRVTIGLRTARDSCRTLLPLRWGAKYPAIPPLFAQIWGAHSGIERLFAATRAPNAHRLSA